MDKEKHSDFLQAYRPCHQSFLRYCSALAYNKMDTEDLVQDVLLSAYRNFEKIRNKDRFLHYLIRAAKFRSHSIRRKRTNKFELLEQYEERLLSQGMAADMLAEINLLYTAIDRLPSAQKDALILFEISGFSMQEIAAIQKSTEGAVKTKVSRARKRLREILGTGDEPKMVTEALQTLRSITL